MYETGTVTAIHGEMVTVSLQRTEACAKCGMCSIGLQGKEMHIQAQNACRAALHDRVRVQLKPDAFLTATAILYGLPLIGLMLGFFVGWGLGALAGLTASRALAGFFCGIIFMGPVFIFIRSRERRRTSDRYVPVAVQVEKETAV